jgi:hypothetical protein
MLCIHPAPREITRIWENKSSGQNINSGPFRAHLTSYALLILCTPRPMTSATVFEHLTFDRITFDHLGTFGGPVLLGGQLHALTCHHVVFDGTIYSENRPVPEKDFEKNLYVPSQRKYDDYIRAREAHICMSRLPGRDWRFSTAATPPSLAWPMSTSPLWRMRRAPSLLPPLWHRLPSPRAIRFDPSPHLRRVVLMNEATELSMPSLSS